MLFFCLFVHVSEMFCYFVVQSNVDVLSRIHRNTRLHLLCAVLQLVHVYVPCLMRFFAVQLGPYVNNEQFCIVFCYHRSQYIVRSDFRLGRYGEI